MSESFSALKRVSFTLLAHSALVRTLYVSLMLIALWGAIYWAEMIA